MAEHTEFINQWMAKIKSGVEYRKKYSTISKWDEYRKAYRGQWDPKVKPINKIYSYGRMLIPRVYFRAPRVCITAPRPDLVIHAKVVEAIDNMLIRETMIKETLKHAILDSYLCGIGPIKLGFDSEFGYIPEQAVGADGDTVTQVSVKTGKRIEYNETVKPGMPWALRCRPDDIIVPWGATEAANLPWIVHYIVRPLKDIKEDQKYKGTADLKGTRTPSQVLGTTGLKFRPTEEKDKEELYGELFEIRDFRSGKMYTICEDKLLLDVDDVLQVEGLPYEFLSFNDDPEYFWPIPDADLLAPNQKELNEISTQLSKHRAIALLKLLYSKDKISEAELLKFLSGDVGPAVGVDAENIASAVMPFQVPIPGELIPAQMNELNIMRETLGFSSNEEGAFQSGSPRSATETMTVAQSFEQRVTERRDIVTDLLTRIIRKWNQYLFKFWTEERVTKIVSPQGENFWIKYTGDQLKGEYFISIDADSGMPVTRGTKYQMASDLMAKFNGDPLVDQILLRQIVLDNYSLVDPRIETLIKNQAPPSVTPEDIANARQPFPAGASAGMGKGAGGGREGSSPERPQEFDSFKKRFNLGGK